MIKLTAIIKPFKIEAVLQRLPQDGIAGVYVSEVRGYGRQKGQLEMYKGEEYELTFLPKARMEIYCDDTALAAVENAVQEGARTGRIGDGKVMIASVEQAEQI